MSAKLSLIALTLAVGCARPPAINGADCPCPGGYQCDVVKSVCVPSTSVDVPPPSSNPGGPSPVPPGPPAICSNTGQVVRYFSRRLVRLTPVQLAHAVEDLTGYVVSPQELPSDVSDELAIDATASGYDATVSPEAAAILADVARRAALALQVPQSCAGATLAAECSDYLNALARQGLRRSLDSEESFQLGSTAADDAALLGAEGAVRLAVEELIQSPQFVYRPELGSDSASGASVTLTGDELASELAFVLTNRPPDGALLDAAPKLTEPAVLADQARRLSVTPAARDKLLRFLEAFANLDRLAFPAESAPPLALLADMQLETSSFLGHVVDGNGGLAELFGAAYTYVTPALASHYGVASPGSGTAPVMMSIPDRTGLLSQGSFLVAHAPGPSGLPSRRGLAMVRMLYDAAVPAPPIGLPPAVAPAPEILARERVGMIVNQPSCAACHLLFDPPGLSLERFDGQGRFRTTQAGKPINPSIDNYSYARGMHFSDGIALGQEAAGTPRTQGGFVEQYVQYVLGSSYSSCALDDVAASFFGAGARIPALLGALPPSRAFVERSRQ